MAGALAFLGNGAGDLGETFPTIGGKLHVHLGFAVHIGPRVGVCNILAGHLGNAFHEETFLELCPVALLLGITHLLVAGRNFTRRDVARGERGMHKAKGELRGFLDVVEDLGVVLGRDTRQFDLDAVVADRADDGFDHAKGIDAGADDLDRLGQFVLADVGGIVAHRLGIDLKRDSDAALQVEAELELALGAAEEFVEQDVVAFLDVLQRALDVDVRVIFREIEFPLRSNLLERHEDARGLAGSLARGGFVEQFGEFSRLGRGVRARIAGERLILQRDQFGHRKGHDQGA